MPCISGRWLWCVANMPSSVNDPVSSNNARRSRAVSFPCACCFAILSAPPKSRAFCRRREISSASGCQVMVLSFGRKCGARQGESHGHHPLKNSLSRIGEGQGKGEYNRDRGKPQRQFAPNQTTEDSYTSSLTE